MPLQLLERMEEGSGTVESPPGGKAEVGRSVRTAAYRGGVGGWGRDSEEMGAERPYIHEGEFTVWMSSRGMANSRIPGELPCSCLFPEVCLSASVPASFIPVCSWITCEAFALFSPWGVQALQKVI